MSAILAVFLWIFCIFVLVRIFRDYLQQRRDLVSLRVLFLVGFLVFLPSSGALTLLTGDGGIYPVANLETTGLLFVVWVLVFYGLFEWTYSKGHLAVALAHRIPRPKASISDPVLVVVALVFLGLNAPLRLIQLGAFSDQVLIPIAGSCRIAAAAIAAWILVGRWKNPVYLAFGGFVFGSILLDMAFTSFSRRPILGVGMALVWVAYYRVLRVQEPRRVLAKLSPLIVLALLGVLFVSGTRSAANRGGDAEDRRANVNFVESVQSGFGKILLWKPGQRRKTPAGLCPCDILLFSPFLEQFGRINQPI